MFLMWRWARRIVTALVVVALVAIFVPIARIEWAGLRQDNVPTDAIVIFGAAQFDGTPSPVLQNRLDHALALYKLGVAPQLVTVGGSRPGDRFTEATAGRNYLHMRGVEWRRIKAVKSGEDTLSSAQAVAKWAVGEGIRSFTVVSDRAHVARASSMLKAFGFEVHSSAPKSGPGSSLTWQYVARETAALLRFWLFEDGDLEQSERRSLSV